MPCSPAKLAANRANALKSTGPRTPEGKARSRANSLHHGLCSTVVVAEDLELVQARTSEWYFTLNPQTPYQAWLVDRIALVTIRIERCERMERRLRDRHSLAAEVGWEEDRRLEAELLGDRIGSKPASVVERLRRTPSGCEWLISRWSMLAHAADVNGSWTPEQVDLAFHLLGTPIQFREGMKPGDLLDEAGKVIESMADPAALARRESAALVERLASASCLEDADRALIEADLLDESNVELRRLRKNEAALHRQMKWYLEQFTFKSPYGSPNPNLRPLWRTDGPPETIAEAAAKAEQLALGGATSQHPPFCLEPEEYPTDGSKIDIGALAIKREVKRLNKAEARREAKRRRLERRRA